MGFKTGCCQGCLCGRQEALLENNMKSFIQLSNWIETHLRLGGRSRLLLLRNKISLPDIGSVSRILNKKVTIVLLTMVSPQLPITHSGSNANMALNLIVCACIL